ncbi:MAG: hypothetical protein ACR2O6_13020 [Ilumatobacteraceae bacterium]
MDTGRSAVRTKANRTGWQAHREPTGRRHRRYDYRRNAPTSLSQAQNWGVPSRNAFNQLSAAGLLIVFRVDTPGAPERELVGIDG